MPNELTIRMITETVRPIFEAVNKKYDAEEILVKELGREIGFGRLMQLAQTSWEESLKEQGWPAGGSFAFGPCLSHVVPCKCTVKGFTSNEGCRWCEGSKHVTKLVRELQDK